MKEGGSESHSPRNYGCHKDSHPEERVHKVELGRRGKTSEGTHLGEPNGFVPVMYISLSNPVICAWP